MTNARSNASWPAFLAFHLWRSRAIWTSKGARHACLHHRPASLATATPWLSVSQAMRMLHRCPELFSTTRRICRLCSHEPAVCAYPHDQVTLLLDAEATGRNIRTALDNLATKTAPDDTAIVFFSGHGAHVPGNGHFQEYILPWDCDLRDLDGSAISGDEMTELLNKIRAGRLLVLFDACHSGGAGDPKTVLLEFNRGLERGVLCRAGPREGSRGHGILTPRRALLGTGRHEE